MTAAPELQEDQAEEIKVLLVDGDPESAAHFRACSKPSDTPRFIGSHAEGVERSLEMLVADAYQVVLLDLALPDSDGLDTLSRAKVAASSVPIIVMTEEDDEAQALGALRMGAQDHLVKSQSSRLVRTLLHAVERHRLIAELHEARRSEHFLATHDALTRLPNRFLFEDQLGRALEHAARRGKQIAVLFVDLDRFKAINDTLGHGVGDELLKEVAKRLTATMRKTDLVARLGGDEFIVMIQDVGGSFGPAKVGESSAPRHFCVGAIRIAAWSLPPRSFQLPRRSV